jgi:hypothetical protein
MIRQNLNFQIKIDSIITVKNSLNAERKTRILKGTKIYYFVSYAAKNQYAMAHYWFPRFSYLN